MLATNGYAFLPGADKQYVVLTTFTLPYAGSLVYSQPFSPPVTSATVIVPEGVKVRSDQLTDGGTQASTGTTAATFHLYQAGNLASGSTLTMTISGKPGDKTGVNLDQRSLIEIGVTALGLILVGVGIFLFLRERKLRMQADEFEVDKKNEKDDEDALGENRESIMDAIISLDDQFKAGGISKEAYTKRREELKDRLRNLV
jgi:cbb3-type cytochrome oxidase subunit 3